jgi:hypothetical protein
VDISRSVTAADAEVARYSKVAIPLMMSGKIITGELSTSLLILVSEVLRCRVPLGDMLGLCYLYEASSVAISVDHCIILDMDKMNAQLDPLLIKSIQTDRVESDCRYASSEGNPSLTPQTSSSPLFPLSPTAGPKDSRNGISYPLSR